eukprot:gene16103-biopygen15791
MADGPPVRFYRPPRSGEGWVYPRGEGYPECRCTLKAAPAGGYDGGSPEQDEPLWPGEEGAPQVSLLAGGRARTRTPQDAPRVRGVLCDSVKSVSHSVSQSVTVPKHHRELVLFISAGRGAHHKLPPGGEVDICGCWYPKSGAP